MDWRAGKRSKGKEGRGFAGRVNFVGLCDQISNVDGLSRRRKGAVRWWCTAGARTRECRKQPPFGLPGCLIAFTNNHMSFRTSACTLGPTSA